MIALLIPVLCLLISEVHCAKRPSKRINNATMTRDQLSPELKTILDMFTADLILMRQVYPKEPNFWRSAVTMKNQSRLKARGDTAVIPEAVERGVRRAFETGRSAVGALWGFLKENLDEIISGLVTVLTQVVKLYLELFGSARKRWERQKEIDILSLDLTILKSKKSRIKQEIEYLGIQIDRESREIKERERNLTKIEVGVKQMEESLRKREERIKEREIRLEQSVKLEVQLQKLSQQKKELTLLLRFEPSQRDYEPFECSILVCGNANYVAHSWLQKENLCWHTFWTVALSYSEKLHDFCWSRSRTDHIESRYKILNEVADRNYTIRNAVKKIWNVWKKKHRVGKDSSRIIRESSQRIRESISDPSQSA